MLNKIFLFVLCMTLLVACSNSEKKVFLKNCLTKGDQMLSAKGNQMSSETENKFHCECMAEAIWSNKNISKEAKKAIANGADIFGIPERDTQFVMAEIMSCYKKAYGEYNKKLRNKTQGL